MVLKRWPAAFRAALLVLLLLPLVAGAVPLRGQTINADGFTLTFTGGATLQVIGTTAGNVFTVQFIVNGVPNAAQTCQGTIGSCQQSFNPIPSANTIENFRADIQTRINATGLGMGWNWSVCSVNPFTVNIVSATTGTPGAPGC